MNISASIPSAILPPSSSSSISSTLSTSPTSATSETAPHNDAASMNQQQNNNNNSPPTILKVGGGGGSRGCSPVPVAKDGSATGGSSGKQPKGSYCILTPCSNSHPFEERRILVIRSAENAVKIGRSIVRLQPAHNNAIFDCKVLSRNHATLWMYEEGRFLIKDTGSSNGTFINNERLSASGEESEPKELFSGDILQLGVEIVDNAKKVASGCVTCIVRLTNEKGEEHAHRPQADSFAFPIRNEHQIPLNYTLVRNDKLFIFDQYIKEAKHRENLLGQKLQTLEDQLNTAQEALQAKWDEHINQELLLSRIELLESQLSFSQNSKKTPCRNNKARNAQTSSPNSMEKENNNNNKEGEDEKDNLRREISELLEDRAKTEQFAKESLRHKCEQMQETSMRLHDVEMALVNVEEECEFLRQRCADYETQLGSQRDNYDTLMLKYNEVCAQLCAAEKASSFVDNPPTHSPPLPPENGVIPVDSGASFNNNNNNNGDDNNLEKPMENNIKDEEKNESNISVDNLSNAINKEGDEQEQQPKVLHNCKEPELLRQLAEFESKIVELQRKMDENSGQHKEDKAEDEKLGETNAAGGNFEKSVAARRTSSSADFQVFLLSILPFLLVFLLLFSPFFYFFGWPSSFGGGGAGESVESAQVEQQPREVSVEDGGEKNAIEKEEGGGAELTE